MWVKQKLEQNTHKNLPILKTKATELPAEMGHSYEPSDSRLNRLIEHHGLKI